MAYVLTSLSGNLISAASAAFAPTNSADVSAIASAYAESAVSSKQDASAMSAYALSSDVSGVIDTVSSNSASWGGGATGDYVEKSAEEVAIGTSASAASLAFAQGYRVSAKSYGLAQGITTLANSYAFAQGHSDSAWSYSLSQGLSNKASATSFAQGHSNSASSNSFAQGNHLSALYSSVVFGGYNLHGNGNTATGDSAAFAIGDGTASDARHDLMLVTKDGEITMYSSTADTTGTGIMSSIRALSANAGGVDSATVSAIASSYAESAASSKLDESATADFYSTSNPSGFITGVDLSDYATTAYVDSAVSGKQDASAMSDYQPTSAMTAYQLSGDYYSASNPSGFITGVDLSDYATTAYVDSSVSSKLDTTAFNSGDFYTTSNPSSFVDSAYVDSAVSGKADNSALSSYVPYSGLEYNTASAISGINGSALAAGSTYSAGEGIDITDDVISVETPVDIVAGPGIVIDNPDGNTLRVSTDENYETDLLSSPMSTSPSTASSTTLSETVKNFERIAIYGNTDDGAGNPFSVIFEVPQSVSGDIMWSCVVTNNGYAKFICGKVNGTSFTMTRLKALQWGGGWADPGSNWTVSRVIGVHRISGGN